nr:ribonucleoside-diphosphate reductase subunit alpha [uncultured Rhodoferax sp.]
MSASFTSHARYSASQLRVPASTDYSLQWEQLSLAVESACLGLGGAVRPQPILAQARHNFYEGMPASEMNACALLAARTLIEQEPAYSYAAARLLLHKLRHEVLETDYQHEDMDVQYPSSLQHFVTLGVQAKLLDERLLQFDLQRLGRALQADRDLQFDYLGLQTLYDRYFLHIEGRRIELPQIFFMRVAMGLALNEPDRNARALEFYEVLSRFDFMCSTPALFNAASRRPQLSSCYITSVPDDLDGIFESFKDNALLSKHAAGLGNAWTRVRALGSRINGNNGVTQGVVPFLKVANDIAVAVDQGGKRKGAFCAYLETWHLDIEEFLELRKNTGDDRRRTHDLNTANWIPDLFMKRVLDGYTDPSDPKRGRWTLFSPSTCADLHDRVGQDFERAYVAYEACAARGEIRQFKTVAALDLWRKMLSMLFETGHPWITFKDACNVRSPQRHAGVIHSSNLCSEITLNTSEEEVAVCNLGSVNLPQHLMVGPGGQWVLDHSKLQATIATGMRMLDNVIDLNDYIVPRARETTQRHRPVGLGMMGFQDALHMLRLPYASLAAVEFADISTEAVCYYAYWASTELARERGRYESYPGSLWDQGLLPIDTLDMLEAERGGWVEVDRSHQLDWTPLRARIQTYGMRNSNCTAIAPTATISNIVGISASIEPNFGNLAVKSNMSGEFTVVNTFMVNELKQLGLWDAAMVMDLKHSNGSLQSIDRVPQALKELYATAFEIGPSWLIEAAARRQKWIDQSQSLNLYVAGASGKKLHDTYVLAWIRGVKTTYYLRTSSATQAEKSTIHRGELNAVSGRQESV